MREIEGIQKIVRRLRPHWKEIEADFERENERFKAMMSKEHDNLGRILKCHLVIENYLDRFLSEHYRIENLDAAKLGFFQKASLLPDGGSAAAFVKPGILKVNTIRNRFGHTLNPVLRMRDLGPISEVLRVARQGVEFKSPIEAIEAFTTVACTWLVVPRPEIQELFMDAFSEVRANAL